MASGWVQWAQPLEGEAQSDQECSAGMSVSRRASFAAGIAAVRRQKKAVRNMTKDNIQEELAEGIFCSWEIFNLNLWPLPSIYCLVYLLQTLVKHWFIFLNSNYTYFLVGHSVNKLIFSFKQFSTLFMTNTKILWKQSIKKVSILNCVCTPFPLSY